MEQAEIADETVTNHGDKDLWFQIDGEAVKICPGEMKVV